MTGHRTLCCAGDFEGVCRKKLTLVLQRFGNMKQLHSLSSCVGFKGWVSPKFANHSTLTLLVNPSERKLLQKPQELLNSLITLFLIKSNCCPRAYILSYLGGVRGGVQVETPEHRGRGAPRGDPRPVLTLFLKQVTLKRGGLFDVSQNFSKYLSQSVKWYCYSPTQILKTTFEDPELRGIFLELIYPEIPPFLNAKSLTVWIQAEFEAFQKLLRYILNEKRVQAHGNPFAQLLHDGGTLQNKKKFQAIGIQFIDPQFRANHVVFVGFVASLTNTDSVVATTIQDTLKKRTGLDFDQCVSSMIQDRSALGVSSQLDIEEEGCLMHDRDKLGRSAIGSLTRSKDKQVIVIFHTLIFPLVQKCLVICGGIW
ncbi:hypothetical protein BDR26DRAFT_901199 [Obelidium mucronatum]|nr:hypothetical protein BDR26DRAFT_901199 [Obelidium mucronatum]